MALALVADGFKDMLDFGEREVAFAPCDDFPPIVVFEHGGQFILADGFHRVKAARKAKLSHILAEVRQGDRRDALRFALALPSHPERSNAE